MRVFNALHLTQGLKYLVDRCGCAPFAQADVLALVRMLETHPGEGTFTRPAILGLVRSGLRGSVDKKPVDANQGDELGAGTPPQTPAPTPSDPGHEAISSLVDWLHDSGLTVSELSTLLGMVNNKSVTPRQLTGL